MGSAASGVRYWNASAFLTAFFLPAASPQNDLNQGGTGNQHRNSQRQASQSLEEEKSRLLAEAAVQLQEENTRQERILALAKQLAVLRGQDPNTGKCGATGLFMSIGKGLPHTRPHSPCQG
jgi:hypothetical protein